MRTLVALMLLGGLGTGALPARADDMSDPFAPAARLKASPADQVRDEVVRWLEARGVEAGAVAEAAEQLGQPAEGQSDLLTRVVASLALGDPRIAELEAMCHAPRRLGVPIDNTWITDAELGPFAAANLRLLLGRWLAQEGLYEESLVQIEGLAPEDVVDPATLLFYQAVVHHRLLNRDAGLKAIARLLGEVGDAPERYRAVAQLMQPDLEALEEETLDHVARRMEDIRRRLELGRAGVRTRAVEDGVIASLDKMIEEMEQQQQQQQQQQQGGAGGSPSPTPAPDSQILPGQGPGEVKPRRIGDTSGWGDLPPKEREEALQQIGKDFPSHYRDAIQDFFRRLAGESNRGTGE